MPDYSQGKIYKIVAQGKTYYGSTTLPLPMRFNDHKNKQSCSSREIVCFEDAKIVLVENYPCETRRDLLMRERYYIDNYECINKLRPYVSLDEAKERQRCYDAKRNQTEKRKQMFRDRELKPERIAYRKAYAEKKQAEQNLLRQLQYYNL